jgi:hypothetical protein
MGLRAVNERDRGWRQENGGRRRIAAIQNKPDSLLGCPDERHCEQRTDQHDHHDEDRSWWIESNAQFTVRKTMGNVDQQVGNNDGGHVLS